MTLRILVIDDHPFLRLGLTMAIKNALPECCIIEADNAEQGISLTVNEAIDLVLLDLSLPQTRGGKESFGYGLAVLNALRLSPNSPPAIVISGTTNEFLIALVQSRGAIFIPKGEPVRKLKDVIERCLTNSRAGTAASARTPITAASLGITPHLFEILKLALRGHSAKQIARALDTNDSNVRHYLSDLYRMFGTTSRGELQNIFTVSGLAMDILSSSEPERLSA